MMFKLNEYKKGLEYIERSTGVIKFTPEHYKIV